jgi:molybdopterin converting factor small subunit
MQVRVNLFARFKDLAGKDQIVVPLTEKATIGDLRQKLMQTFSTAAGLLKRSALAVDNEIADDNRPIPENVEIALLPPVSGG